ncbi:MAG: SDR family oxidoreductase [Desulfobacterales bacterium]|nr:SDR family oxidoreductase [Desulfobacterales bacterium]
MNILIIGATRGIGYQLLEYALSKDHKVTTLVRDPNKLEILLENENLDVIKGDILDYGSVRKAVKGKDTVLTCVGVNITRKPVDVFSRGIKNVIKAMEDRDVSTLISVTGIGAGNSKGHGGFLYDKIFNPLFLKTIYEDKDREEELIKSSDLDWIIVRPGFLTNGTMCGKYRVITDLNGIKSGKISRNDVAHFLLEQAVTPEYVRQTPLICY